MKVVVCYVNTSSSSAAALLSVCGQAFLTACCTQITLGALLGGYETTSFKSKGKPSPLDAVELLAFDAAAAREGAAEGVALARAVMLARWVADALENRIRTSPAFVVCYLFLAGAPFPLHPLPK